VFDVLLGGEVSVTSIEGKPLTVSIPSSFDSSKKLRLAGQGMPDPFNGTRGDILVELFVDYPVLSEAQLELIRQAAKPTEVTV
jgi:molecular chaperone DnaJ